MIMPSPDRTEADVEAFLGAAAALDHTTPLDRALPEAADRLLPHLGQRAAMIALLEAREALDVAGAYGCARPRELAALRLYAGLVGTNTWPAELAAWAHRQAEAWRELAWAIAVNAVSEDHVAAAVAR
jgi:hypothetical protein